MTAVDIVLQHNLLGGVVETNRRQPAAVGQRPAFLAGIDAPMPQQETLQMLTRLAEHPHRCCARPNQIAHRLMGGIRNPHRRQFAGAVQFGQHHRVSPVRLDPIAGFHRNQRGRHDHAVMAKICELPIKTIAARPGLVAETSVAGRQSCEALDQLGDLIGAVRKIAELAYLAAAQPLPRRPRNRRLMDIQSHEDGIVHQARPPCLRLGAGLSGATLDWGMPWDGPPAFSRGEHRV